MQLQGLEQLQATSSQCPTLKTTPIRPKKGLAKCSERKPVSILGTDVATIRRELPRCNLTVLRRPFGLQAWVECSLR
jgi:hypothetical protein